jgi:NAD-dependent dihydropyrimidine dehydrogenase PreA subunit
MNNLVYLKDVVTLELDKEKCNGCGMCIKVCPHEVFGLKEGRAHIINRDFCMDCGACSLNCPAFSTILNLLVVVQIIINAGMTSDLEKRILNKMLTGLVQTKNGYC